MTDSLESMWGRLAACGGLLDRPLVLSSLEEGGLRVRRRQGARLT
jgi:hypothetical protein